MWELYKLSLPGWYIFLTDGSPSFSMATNAHFKENLLSEHSSYDKVSIVVQHVWIIYLVQFIVKLHSGTQEKHNGEIQLRSISKQAEDQEISWSGTEGRQVCAELGQEQGVSISDNQGSEHNAGTRDIYKHGIWQQAWQSPWWSSPEDYRCFAGAADQESGTGETERGGRHTGTDRQPFVACHVLSSSYVPHMLFTKEHQSILCDQGHISL